MGMKMEKKMENLLKTEGISYMGFGIVGKAVMTDSVLTPEAKAISCFLCRSQGILLSHTGKNSL